MIEETLMLDTSSVAAADLAADIENSDIDSQLVRVNLLKDYKEYMVKA